MDITRRSFLRLVGGTLAATTVGVRTKPALAQPRKIRYTKEVPSVCPYCGVGCGIIAHVRDGEVINIEGNPNSPINKGTLCPKGQALYQIAHNKNRITDILYRAPGSTKWEKKNWDWAITQIAKRIKATRDANWMETTKSTDALATLGSVFLTNEEAYALTKLVRPLGVIYNENEARICVSSGIKALTVTLGRGPMTNQWMDLENSNCIMCIGSNPAESFPVGFGWALKAQEKGAKIISVDPLFTKTSAVADVFVRLRASTDSAFTAGIINYIISNRKYNKEYLIKNTDASLLVDSSFDFKDGLFTGFDKAKHAYSKTTWQYQKDTDGKPKMDKTLQDPSCVFQIVKKHFSRYDADTVCKITGVEKNIFLNACKAFAATGSDDKAGAIIFSSSATQHGNGTQNVRTLAILQLLLGNIGVSGGGLNGIAGACNGLGCSLNGRLFHELPGGLGMPRPQDKDFDGYLGRVSSSKAISFLKAWYGNKATSSNDYGWNYLPKLSGNRTYLAIIDAIDKKVVKGLICWAINPAVSTPYSTFTRNALRKLDWMVVVDPFETETAAVWKEPGIDPSKSNTEVFLLPAASPLEKEGSTTNSARLMQWRNKIINPVGQSKADLWIIDKIVKKLKELYVKEDGPNKKAITDLVWNYGNIPDPHKVAKEINGYNLKTGKLLAGSWELKANGETSCGNPIFCGSYTEKGNMAARRDMADRSGIGLYPDWGWSFPSNIRIMYNRASVNNDGRPVNPGKPIIVWDALTKKWKGDVPDGGAEPGKILPFPKKPYRRAHLFAIELNDGPLPEYYEPWESPTKNIMSSIQNSPSLKIWNSSRNRKGSYKQYPIVATYKRLVAHVHTGSFTRNVPWLSELEPAMFVIMSHELGSEKGIANGDKVYIKSARGSIEAFALVSKRVRPLKINGSIVHQIILPWNWGYAGASKGDSANILSAHVTDANTMIPAIRGFLVDMNKVTG